MGLSWERVFNPVHTCSPTFAHVSLVSNRKQKRGGSLSVARHRRCCFQASLSCLSPHLLPVMNVEVHPRLPKIDGQKRHTPSFSYLARTCMSALRCLRTSSPPPPPPPPPPPSRTRARALVSLVSLVLLVSLVSLVSLVLQEGAVVPLTMVKWRWVLVVGSAREMERFAGCSWERRIMAEEATMVCSPFRPGPKPTPPRAPVYLAYDRLCGSLTLD